MKHYNLKGIYAITAPNQLPNSELFKCMQEAIKAGICAFQLRDKTHSNSEIKNFCLEANEYCMQHNTLFVLNDRVELALELQLEGLHIGIEDWENDEMQTLRQAFGGIIGISCYNDLDRAINAAKIGFDYLSFGSAFPSKTKPNAKQLDFNLLKKVASLKIPRCVLGGIDATRLKNTPEISQNCEMIAASSSIWSGGIECIAKNILALREAMGYKI